MVKDFPNLDLQFSTYADDVQQTYSNLSLNGNFLLLQRLDDIYVRPYIPSYLEVLIHLWAIGELR